MINILLSYAHYPISVAAFFKRAFLKLGCNVMTVGPYHVSIPWAPHHDFSQYQDIPDLIMPNEPVGDMEYVLEHDLTRSFKPDVLIQIDAGYWLRYKDGQSPPIKTVHLATDPHCLEYSEQFKLCHFPCIMQYYYGMRYRSDLDIAIQWVPYGFDPHIHYWLPHRRIEHDITLLSGLLYPNRLEALEAFRQAGLKVYRGIALYEEGTRIYNRGLIAFNWSSQRDLPMRFWEGLAYRNVVLTNRVPDLATFTEFQEGQHYLAFDTLEECVEKAVWAVKNREKAQRIAEAGYARVWIGRHTYTRRAIQLLNIAGFDI